MAEKYEFPRIFNTWKMGAGILGVIGAAIAVFILISDQQRFFQGYMYAYIFWLALTLGCYILTLITHVTRSSWGGSILRIVEAGSANLWFMALLTIPVIYAAWSGTAILFPWADPANVAGSVHLKGKINYLNPAFFTIRIILYFGIWMLWSSKLRKWSIEEDETRSRDVNQARVNWSAPGIVVFCLTVTFAFTDLVMSLDPLWYSTIWGIWWMVCIGMAATAFAILVLSQLVDVPPFSDIITPGLFRDLGNVLLTFVMFWGYISISQWLIIYSGNLPEEITYYIQRGLGAGTPPGAWWALGVFIAFAQFFMPFLLLLSGRTKRTPAMLGSLAAWILFVRVLDVFWTVVPFFRIAPAKPNLITLVAAAGALIGIGGIWLFMWVGNLAKARLLPQHNMFLPESAEKQHAH